MEPNKVNWNDNFIPVGELLSLHRVFMLLTKHCSYKELTELTNALISELTGSDTALFEVEEHLNSLLGKEK